MTTTSAVLWRKEVRELMPWWAGTMVTMVSCWALMRPDFIPIDWLFKWAVDARRGTFLAVGLCAYAAGAITLGALSLGQEYAHQTLPDLLTHPVSRGRILLVKLTVLAAMLTALGGLAFGAWGSDPVLVGQPGDVRMLLPAVLPLAASLLLAPWFTMVARGALGGAVFTAVLPAFLWMAGASFRMSIPLLWAASVALGVLGAVMTWRTFMRLEVTGSSQSDIDLSDWFSRSKGQVRVARTQNPVWQLVKKEFRLQQVTFLVSGAYVIGWLLINMGRRLAPDLIPESALYVTEFLQGGVVPVMLGALACAEERRLGAADWHTLLPFAAWKQWTIKAGMVILLAVALTFVLPELLQTIAVDANLRLEYEPTTAIGLCVIALYVSSLSSSGLRALLVTYPVIGVAFVGGLWGANILSDVSGPAIRWLARAAQHFLQLDHNSRTLWLAMSGDWVAIGFLLLLLRFAYTNHRTAERSSRRTGRQIAWLTAFGMVSVLVTMLALQILVNSRGNFRPRPLPQRPGVLSSPPARGPVLPPGRKLGYN